MNTTQEYKLFSRLLGLSHNQFYICSISKRSNIISTTWYIYILDYLSWFINEVSTIADILHLERQFLKSTCDWQRDYPTNWIMRKKKPFFLHQFIISFQYLFQAASSLALLLTSRKLWQCTSFVGVCIQAKTQHLLAWKTVNDPYFKITVHKDKAICRKESGTWMRKVC